MPRDILENVWKRYRKACEILGYEDNIILELTSFKRRLSFDLNAVVGGKPTRLKAVRIWHRGPLTDSIRKGGNRYREGITLGSLESHAAEMSPKCWMHELPFGGAKGGIDVDPNKCTPEELEQITYTFVDELDEAASIGPFRDVPAPDIGTNPLIMFWMSERYSYRHRGEPYVKAVVTGKPVKLENAYVGGIHGRLEATGFGLTIALDELRKEKYALFTLPEHATIAMQGFGNVGSYAAYYAYQNGFRIIAIGDEFGQIYNPCGIDIPELIRYANTRKPKTIVGFPNAEQISCESLFEIPCDIFIPAALEEAITEKNAHLIRAKVILEGANGPTTPEADAILEDRGIIVVPDIYANSGGVVTSYFEWGQNTHHPDIRIPQQNNSAIVLKALEKMMRKAGAEIVQRKQKHTVSLRLAAYIFALEKAELLRVRRIPEYAMQILG